MMKYSINILGFILLLLISSSCEHPQDSCEVKEIFVPFKNIERSDKIDRLSLFDSVDLIFLESKDSISPIGVIKDIRIADGLLFISDALVIHIFDMNGKYVNIINRHGRGHGEYLSLSKFDINTNNKTIHIYDLIQRKILKYSYDGSFVGEILLETNLFRDFSILPNGDYLCYLADYEDGARRGLWQTDSNFVFVKQLVRIDDSFRLGTMREHSLVHINDSIIGLMGGEDVNCFYQISIDTIVKSYKMTCDLRIPKRIQMSETIKESNKNKLYGKESYMETDRILSFVVTNYGGDDVQVVYDKVKDQCYRIYDYFDYQDNIEEFSKKNLPPTLPLFYHSDHGFIIGYFSAADIMFSSNFQSLFPNIKEYSNPVVYLLY